MEPEEKSQDRKLPEPVPLNYEPPRLRSGVAFVISMVAASALLGCAALLAFVALLAFASDNHTLLVIMYVGLAVLGGGAMWAMVKSGPGKAFRIPIILALLGVGIIVLVIGTCSQYTLVIR